MTDKDIKNHFDSVEDFFVHRINTSPQDDPIEELTDDFLYFYSVRDNYEKTGGLPTYG